MKAKHYFWLIILGAIAYLLISRWRVWFGVVHEPSYLLPDAPQRLFITPGENGLKDRSFSWVSGSDLPFIYTLRKDSTETQYTPEVHEITSEGGTTYVYNVKLKDLDSGAYTCFISTENLTDTLWGSFDIKLDDGVLELLLLGDIQDPKEVGSGRFLHDVYEHFPNADAWLFVGDMIERPHDQYWKLFYSTVSDIAPCTPFIPVSGNHEYNTGGFAHVGPRYTTTFPMPLNGNKERLGVNFFVDFPEVRVVGLDTNMLIRDIFSTRSWLRSTLGQSSAPFTIVMGHHGVRSVKKDRLNAFVAWGLDPLYKRYQVDLVLQGHDHAFARDGEESQENTNRPIYITQTSSAKTYEVSDPNKHIKSLSGERLYSRFRITMDTLYYETYREDHTLFDSFQLPKRQ